jgi:superoxide dismutase, Fe-Mn family
MAFTLPPLPYAIDALAPHISQETLEFHHGKHHNSYVEKLNGLVEAKTNDDLEAVILEAEPGSGVFNNAGQHWNHCFYWASMTPGGGGEPEGELAEAIARDFGSFEDFKQQLNEAAATHFGSGWAWLAHDGSKLVVTHTSDADLPFKHSQKALLTIDVWEHAYYIDYRNKRPDYVSAFLDHLVSWDFAAENLKAV